MMSLFIVLWLMGSSEKVKRAVAGYFNDPKGTGAQLGTTMTGTGTTVSQATTDELQKLKEKLEEEIKARKDLEKLSKQIEITITPEGLRIEMIEGKDGVSGAFWVPLQLIGSSIVPSSLAMSSRVAPVPASSGFAGFATSGCPSVAFSGHSGGVSSPSNT